MLVTRRCVGAAVAGRCVSSALPTTAIPLRYLVAPALLRSAPGHALDPPKKKEQHSRQKSDTNSDKKKAAQGRKPRRSARSVKGLVLCSAAQALGRLTGAGVRALAAETVSSVTSFSGIGGIVLGGFGLSLARKGIRRWQARRAYSKAVASMDTAPSRQITIVTFNLRGIMDRWQERAPVLQQCLGNLEADVFCFQEVLTGG